MPFARCASHRARERLERALGRRPTYFYWSLSSRRGNHKGIAEVTEGEKTVARSVKGVSIIQPRYEQHLRPCWTD